ncbi:MAG: metal-dependent transcriptional regulator [Clostridia bacterium]|nr:metal-dependent transcriptional regulator [Clostridia bacterium]
MKRTQSVEDYLEAILMVQEEKGTCRAIDIAQHLGFSKPSVSVALRNLEKDGSVLRGNDGSVQLTEKGRAIAESVLDRHRFLTNFLIMVGVDPATAEEDACGMEHTLSAESFERFRAWVEKVDVHNEDREN